MEKVINLSNEKEFFWDEYLIDTNLTTATLEVENPKRCEERFAFDMGNEKEIAISYPCTLKDNNGYKTYYFVWNSLGDLASPRGYLAVIESKDGINWYRPNLNILNHPELEINNAVLDNIYDGLFVFYDENPLCNHKEKYKAVGVYYTENELGEKKRALWCFVSEDGYHFTIKNMITDKGFFDSLNTVVFRNGEYACYFRGYHKPIDNPNGKSIRDIRVIYSKDFTTWSEPKMIEFSDGLDEPLYTNNVQIYPNCKNRLIGFPVRYTERQAWTENMEQIKSAQVKKSAMQEHEQRTGLAVTDCIFICSRDGNFWHRFNEAFLTPDYENDNNWVYGDCYFAYGLIDGGKEKYYMYAYDNHRSKGLKKPYIRYEIRKDGFACIKAKSKEEVVVTKPIIFTGNNLHLNFKTSAKGYIYVDVLDENCNILSTISSFEIFGDNIDRKISFADGSDFSKYQNTKIRLRFRMSEAKLYSIWFE